MTLEEFLLQTEGDVRDQVNDRMSAGGYVRAETVFTDIVMQHMAEAAMTYQPETLHIERKIGNANIKLNGYSVSEDADRLDLFVTIFDGLDELQQIADSEVTRSAEQCLKFLGACADGKLLKSIDPSEDVYSFAVTVKDCYEGLDQIRVFVLTDRQAKTRGYVSREVAGKLVRLEVMDIERLYRHWAEGKPRDEIVINFEEVCGSPLPCVYVPGENDEYDYALTAIPGMALRLIYEKFGASLLEANVRAFLSATQKTNQGIRETLRSAPERFMAYNNGIVLITDKAGLARTADGSAGISWLKGMQIVNGGQTTASIYFTKRQFPDTDLSRVRVPAKIIVLKDQDGAAEENIISDISKFANTQTAVKASDLSANKPFHVQLEKLSRDIYCPDGTGRWFYERAAGSYNVMLAREGTTPARLRQLKEAVPATRKLTKTDVAKFIQAYAGKPHLVSLGDQKNFQKLMDTMTDDDFVADVAGYKRLIAKGILFKTTHKLVRAQGFPAGAANIAAYAVSLIGDELRDRLSLDAIWQKQAISGPMADYVKDLSVEVNKHLVRTANGRLVSEWAKKEECWTEMRSADLLKPPRSIPEIT